MLAFSEEDASIVNRLATNPVKSSTAQKVTTLHTVIVFNLECSYADEILAIADIISRALLQMKSTAAALVVTLY
jgi:hypothetical protein